MVKLSKCHSAKVFKSYGECTCSYCLQPCKVARFNWFKIFIGIIVFMSIIGCSHKLHSDRFYQIPPKEKDTVAFNDVKLNDDSISVFLISHGCILPNVAVKQFKLESAYYTSPICKENKNIAGIKPNKHGYCIGVNRGHAVYKTYKDCLLDYIRIQNMYLKNIDGVYAESKIYIQSLKN